MENELSLRYVANLRLDGIPFCFDATGSGYVSLAMLPDNDDDAETLIRSLEATISYLRDHRDLRRRINAAVGSLPLLDVPHYAPKYPDDDLVRMRRGNGGDHA